MVPHFGNLQRSQKIRHHEILKCFGHQLWSLSLNSCFKLRQALGKGQPRKEKICKKIQFGAWREFYLRLEA